MKEIYASMAGTVLNVLVEKEEHITKGQQVIILESMKMEIPIESSLEGAVNEINVEIGDFVNEGDVLIVLG
ncbi:biotin/lipoyl-containing protein [Cytobacillus sp. IB215665]|uniref:biotin/lipoyl-containing protein n=1 Tax=Cytobacillus sp. IB215665 TaxID=3097357 RepID=UPI002A15BC08|nr:biotin/lipoyl-containing protein [Cytobacillus sp. IB215665]MDX8364958.1 biotin/lipoyl-containing protein [Cytobacillus sp. IB215665]